MSEENNRNNSGIGFFGLLQIAFIVLKLTGVIGWKWWVVLIPAEVAALVAVICLLMLLFVLIMSWKEKRGIRND